MRKYSFLLVAFTLLFASCNNNNESNKINVRLQWIPQAQFAGYIVALQKGYYKDKGLDINLLPAGPDLKPHLTVASGSDQIGVGVPNQVITARSNGVPLVAFAQIFQDSPNRYVLKTENKIDSLQQLKGKKIGLWLGGDEVEFVAMLQSVGMSLKDVELIPQEFSIVPFLENKYVLSQVTNYGELNALRKEGLTNDKLQILSPKDYNSAILGDMLFCKEDYLKNNQELLAKFLEASILGWKFAIEKPEETIKILVAYNKELNEDEQRQQLKSVIELIKTGKTLSEGLGYIDEQDYQTAERILFESKQINNHLDIKKCYDLSIWNKVDKSVKQVKKQG